MYIRVFCSRYKQIGQQTKGYSYIRIQCRRKNFRFLLKICVYRERAYFVVNFDTDVGRKLVLLLAAGVQQTEPQLHLDDVLHLSRIADVAAKCVQTNKSQ